jgi:hypothetical protein
MLAAEPSTFERLSFHRRCRLNTGLAKVAVQCSADTFVVNQTFVFLMNICGASPALRVAAERYDRPSEKYRVLKTSK